MKSKLLTWVSAISAVALVSGILVLSANAQIGASTSPISTEGPDLVSAEADGNDIIACFDEEVADFSLDTGLAHLQDYDSDVDADSDAGDLGDQDECVEIGFDNTRPADTFTILEVEDGAVEDRAGNENVDNSVEISNSAATGGPGRTTAPNLVDFDVDEGNEEITYTFDEEVDCGSIAGNEEEFGAYDEDGEADYGDAINDCDDTEVSVEFDATDIDAGFLITEGVEDVFVNDDDLSAAQGNICNEAPSGNCTGTEGIGDDINEFPMAEDAERTDDDTWLINFSEDVDEATCDEDEIFLYEEDGTEHTAEAASCDNDEDDSIEVQFSDAGIEDSTDSELPLIALGDCAIEDSDDGNCSPVRSLPVGSSGETGGFSDGPDLEELSKVAEDILAFKYDEPVDEDGVVDGNEDAFHTLDAEGNSSSGTDIDEVDGNVVQVEFDEEDIADAVGASADYGAADDFLGNVSPLAAAGLGTAQSSGATTSGGTATTTSSTTTTVTTGGNQTRRIPTTLTGRYAKKAGAFKGSVGSARNQCIRGRLVSILKRGKVKGTDTSSRSGGWKIRKPNAKGRYKAHVAKKVFTAANGDKIICLADDSPTIRVRRR